MKRLHLAHAEKEKRVHVLAAGGEKIHKWSALCGKKMHYELVKWALTAYPFCRECRRLCHDPDAVPVEEVR